MSAPVSSGRQKARAIRGDGWTASRQLLFLDTLATTRCVGKASAAAGMSRTSAYRLRARREGALFAALWDRAMEPQGEVYTPPLTDGRLMRDLGKHFSQGFADFAAVRQLLERDPPANRP